LPERRRCQIWSGASRSSSRPLSRPRSPDPLRPMGDSSTVCPIAPRPPTSAACWPVYPFPSVAFPAGNFSISATRSALLIPGTVPVVWTGAGWASTAAPFLCASTTRATKASIAMLAVVRCSCRKGAAPLNDSLMDASRTRLVDRLPIGSAEIGKSHIPIAPDRTAICLGPRRANVVGRVVTEQVKATRPSPYEGWSREEKVRAAQTFTHVSAPSQDGLS
jgi:hypothetical protein